MSRSTGQVDHAVLAILELLDKRWTWQVLYCIYTLEPIGYNDLRKALAGPTHSVVVARLQVLTSFGYLSRAVDPGPPVRTSYSIGPRGGALRPALARFDALADLTEAP